MNNADAGHGEIASPSDVVGAARPWASARVTLWAGALYLLLLLFLVVLRTELDPTTTVISEYALGRHGWLMTLGFVLWAVAYASLLVALAPYARGVTGRIGLVVLAATIVGLLLAAVFQTDPMSTQATVRTVHGRIHEWAALLAGNLPLAAIFFSISLPRHAAWRSARRTLWLATAFAWSCDIIFIVWLASMRDNLNAAPLGWLGRLSVFGQCTCAMVMAWRAGRLRPVGA